LAKIKRTREEMQITLENMKKVVMNSPRSVLKNNNIVEEGGALGSGVKKEHESLDGTRNDEGHNGTIYNTNSGHGSASSGTCS
jgi:hypothetical protein